MGKSEVIFLRISIGDQKRGSLFFSLLITGWAAGWLCSMSPAASGLCAVSAVVPAVPEPQCSRVTQ